MKNDFNINITEINQYADMSLSSVFDTLLQNIETQFIQEVNPMFVYLVQQLSKRKFHENSEFKLKKKLDKFESLQYKIKYRDFRIKFTIQTRQTDPGHQIKYTVKYKKSDVFSAGYRHQVYEKFNSPNSDETIPPSVYKDNFVSSIRYPRYAHQIDLFIRLIDNLDTFLSRDDNNEPIEGYVRVDTIKKRELTKLIQENTFSVI